MATESGRRGKKARENMKAGRSPAHGRFQDAAFAARKRDRRHGAQIANVEFLQQFVDLMLALRLVLFVNFAHGVGYSVPPSGRKDRCFLRQIADAKPCAAIHRIEVTCAVDLDRTSSTDQPVIM